MKDRSKLKTTSSDVARNTAATTEEETTVSADRAAAAPTDGAAVQNGRKAVRHFVVGIGASAGGLEAIERFFDNMPPDPGLSFVLVQHLSPDFRSLMDELLARHTKLAIHRVQDGVVIEPNAIYLIPPKKNMVLANGRLLLTDQDPKAGLNLPIDILFRSLAQDAGDHAIAIVLSGTGSDGSRGIKEIHEAGGLVLVQDPETSGFDGMPRAAVSTGVVDLVLPPEAMPQRLLQYVNHPSQMMEDISAETGRSDELEQLFHLLRRRFGVDFTLYKPGTIARRLERRMTLCDLQSPAEYVRLLESDVEELEALHRDLLVEVTQFFRDKQAFEILRRKVIPAIYEQALAGEEIRVWTPGCATGEEAYSLAILFHDHARTQGIPANVKIFATDVHKTSLEIASNGVYSEQSIAELPPGFLTRYFVERRGRYLVNPEVRQMVIFAPHNLTKDPPFTKLDMITCRNVLIYLNPPTQKKILSLFHFGLKTGGMLFLGPSESVTDLENEFEIVDAHWKIFRKRRDIRLPNAVRIDAMKPGMETAIQVRERLTGQTPSEPRGAAVYELLLQRFVPPSLLLNEQGELVHAFGDARKYLRVPEGKATTDVLRMVDDNLRMAISSALHRSVRDRKNIVYNGVRINAGEHDHHLRVTIVPLPDKRTRSTLHLVCLEEEKENPPPPTPRIQNFDAAGEATERINELAQELVWTKEHLQTTIEELETSNEELQSTNEELVASNEELQSTNEELHSVNEELYTVNAEHQRKIEELLQLTTDMDNLLRSTDIGTLFLDNELNIRKFTPAAARVFNLLPHDLGRPLKHISNNIGMRYDELQRLIEQMARTENVVEREVAGTHDDFYLMRILPYRSQNQVMTGVVLTFVEVTPLKDAQRELEWKERRLRMALEVGDICTWAWELDRNVLQVGNRFASFHGLKEKETPTTFEQFAELVHPEDRERFESHVSRALAENSRIEVDYRIAQQDGTVRYVLTRVDVDRDPDGKPVRLLGVSIDVSERRRMQEALQESKQLLQAILDNSFTAIFARDREGRYTYCNQQLLRQYNLAEEQILGHTDVERFPPDQAALHQANDEEVLQQGRVITGELLVSSSEGERHLLMVKFPLRDAAGNIRGLGGIATDVTALKMAEREAREALVRRDHFLAMLSHELRNPLGALLNATFVIQDEKVEPAIRAEAQLVIQRQAEQMARLLDDLLDVSRIAQNKIHLRLGCVDLAGIIQDAVRTCRARIDTAQLCLAVELCDGPLYVKGDAARLQQAVLNLLINAAKYTPAGGRIDVCLTRHEDRGLIKVKDTGIGISADMLEKIFEVFVQSDASLDRTGGGLGVGLTLVRSIVQLHDGTVTARSDGLGKGSEFRIDLPLTDEVPPPEEVVASPATLVRKPDILLVEDNTDSRRMLEMLLRLEGFPVHSCSDGREGLDAILRTRPAVAIVDIGLPELNGYEVAREVRTHLGSDTIHLVALTGYGRPEDRRAVREAGFNDHLVKPLQHAELMEVLQRVARKMGGG